MAWGGAARSCEEYVRVNRDVEGQGEGVILVSLVISSPVRLGRRCSSTGWKLRLLYR